jgi:hypothetical protein
VGSRRAAVDGEEEALLGDAPVLGDVEELRAALVGRQRDEAAVREGRVLLEPVDGAAELVAADRRVAVP